ncbi:MAG: hypothetical protein H6742_10340 [Alphaproteobacteria bacterium]|nr:hypothetical protein [Alphaproteobacteria bacterium]
MEVGLIHLHRTLGYLAFVAALVNLVLALTKGRTDARIATVQHHVHNLGLLMSGRINVVLGLTMIFVLSYPLDVWWAWVSLVLWVPVEIVGKRMVKSELAVARDGGTAASRLVAGAGIELLVMVAIFGLMSARPG